MTDRSAKGKAQKCCKTCALYDIEYATDRAGRVRKNSVAECRWKSSEVTPLSVRDSPPRPSWMSPQEGVDCPCWEKRP